MPGVTSSKIKKIIFNNTQLTKTYKEILNLQKFHDLTRRRVSRQRRKKPGVFDQTSFLYIRSHQRDNGARPLKREDYYPTILLCRHDPPHVSSPDITWRLKDTEEIGPYPFVITYQPAGTKIITSCTVQNSGDMDVPAATVELRAFPDTVHWMADNNIQDSILLGIQSLLIEGVSSQVVEFEWEMPRELCNVTQLFLGVRIFSIVSNDTPENWDIFCPVRDRHCASASADFRMPCHMQRYP